MAASRVTSAAPETSGRRPLPRWISFVPSDVDGTLVTDQKVLTEAGQKLRATRTAFAITNSRPPAGLRMLIEPLGIGTPMAANGAKRRLAAHAGPIRGHYG